MLELHDGIVQDTVLNQCAISVDLKIHTLKYLQCFMWTAIQITAGMLISRQCVQTVRDFFIEKV